MLTVSTSFCVDSKYTIWGEDLIMYTTVESLFYILESNIILYNKIIFKSTQKKVSGLEKKKESYYLPQTRQTIRANEGI